MLFTVANTFSPKIEVATEDPDGFGNILSKLPTLLPVPKPTLPPALGSVMPLPPKSFLALWRKGKHGIIPAWSSDGNTEYHAANCCSFNESQHRKGGVGQGRREPGELQALHRRERLGVSTCTSPGSWVCVLWGWVCVL